MSSRRTFLKSSAAVLAAPSLSPAVVGPDKLTVALIGCGGMGTNHLKLLAKNPQLSIAHVCDADSNRLADAAKIAADAGHAVKADEGHAHGASTTRRVEAVWIATPDHWHAPGGDPRRRRRQARLRREAVLAQHPRGPAA